MNITFYGLREGLMLGKYDNPDEFFEFAKDIKNTISGYQIDIGYSNSINITSSPNRNHNLFEDDEIKTLFQFFDSMYFDCDYISDKTKFIKTTRSYIVPSKYSRKYHVKTRLSQYNIAEDERIRERDYTPKIKPEGAGEYCIHINDENFWAGLSYKNIRNIYSAVQDIILKSYWLVYLLNAVPRDFVGRKFSF